MTKLKGEGKKVICYGAASKATTVFNYCGIGPDLIDYIVDTTTDKQGKLSPGMHIPVYPDKKLLEDQPDYALILAWNFADEIIQNNSKYQENGGKFIIPTPKPKIV